MRIILPNINNQNRIGLYHLYFVQEEDEMSQKNEDFV